MQPQRSQSRAGNGMLRSPEFRDEPKKSTPSLLDSTGAGWVDGGRSAQRVRARVTYAVLAAVVVGYVAAWFSSTSAAWRRPLLEPPSIPRHPGAAARCQSTPVHSAIRL